MITTEDAKKAAIVSRRFHGSIFRARLVRGQAVVEFELIATAAIIVLVVGIQLAPIAQAALAVSQLSFAGARYASFNTSYAQSQIQSSMVQEGSPTITSNNGANLTIAVARSTNADGSYFGQPVTARITYNAKGRLVLPNPLLGITFPTTLTAQETAVQERALGTIIHFMQPDVE